MTGAAATAFAGWPASAPRAGTGRLPATSFYANLEGLRLVEQTGRALNPRQLLGRFALVNFVFTGCSSVCPVQTRALVELQGTLPPPLRERLQLVSISLDPLNDTPQALQTYAQRMGAGAGWRFVTGHPSDIDRLVTALRLLRPEPGARKPEDHSTALWLVDPQGQLRFRYAGNPPDVARIARELASLDAMARAGTLPPAS